MPVQGLPAVPSTLLCVGAGCCTLVVVSFLMVLSHAHSPSIDDQDDVELEADDSDSSLRSGCCCIRCHRPETLAAQSSLSSNLAVRIISHYGLYGQLGWRFTYRSYSSWSFFRRCSLNSPSKVATPIETPTIVASATGSIRPAISSYNSQQ